MRPSQRGVEMKRTSAFAAENPIAAAAAAAAAGGGAPKDGADEAAVASVGAGRETEAGGGRLVCPPGALARDETLGCRLLLSLTAVSLMWIASLSVAVSLTDALVEQPSADLVRDTCRHAYDSTKVARSDYKACVSGQMASCRGAYDAARAEAVEAADAALASNAARLEAFAATQAACSATVTSSVSALSEWQALSTAHVVPYACALNDTATCAAPCDAAEAAAGNKGNFSCACAAAADLVGDVGAVRSEAFATATGFAATSQSTVDALAAYATARAAYDASYVENKTATIRAGKG